MAATAMDVDLITAINVSQSMAGAIEFQDKYFRTDIGLDLVNLKKQS